jgi:hypothetical protein
MSTISPHAHSVDPYLQVVRGRHALPVGRQVVHEAGPTRLWELATAKGGPDVSGPDSGINALLNAASHSSRLGLGSRCSLWSWSRLTVKSQSAQSRCKVTCTPPSPLQVGWQSSRVGRQSIRPSHESMTRHSLVLECHKLAQRRV